MTDNFEFCGEYTITVPQINLIYTSALTTITSLQNSLENELNIYYKGFVISPKNIMTFDKDEKKIELVFPNMYFVIVKIHDKNNIRQVTFHSYNAPCIPDLLSIIDIIVPHKDNSPNHWIYKTIINQKEQLLTAYTPKKTTHLDLVPSKKDFVVNYQNVTYTGNKDDVLKLLGNKNIMVKNTERIVRDWSFGSLSSLASGVKEFTLVNNNEISLKIVFTTSCFGYSYSQFLLETIENFQKFKLVVPKTTQVSNLKHLIKLETSLPINLQEMYFSGEKLQNDKLLSDYNIDNNEIIHACVRLGHKSSLSRT